MNASKGSESPDAFMALSYLNARSVVSKSAGVQNVAFSGVLRSRTFFFKSPSSTERQIFKTTDFMNYPVI